MKGIGPLFVAFAALIILITIVTGSGIFLAAKSANIHRTSRETAVIGGINSMELLKDGLVQSLAYSSYQGFYTLSMNGGYDQIPSTVKTSNGIPYWRIYDDVSGYPSDWGIRIQNLILNYLNQYTKAFASKEISIPSYQVIVACGTSACNVNALGQGKLAYTTDFFQLMDIATMTKTINTYFHSLFDQATQNYVSTASPNINSGQSRDSIQTAIIAAKSSLPLECTQYSDSYCENEQPKTCEGHYSLLACADTFRQNIGKQLSNLQSTGIIQTDLNVASIAVGHTTNALPPTNDFSCGCKPGTTVCDSHGACTCTHYQRTYISCTYDNYGAAKVLISLTDNTPQNQYPVYDSTKGTTDMKKTILQFYVISGSDYTQAKSLISP